MRPYNNSQVTAAFASGDIEDSSQRVRPQLSEVLARHWPERRYAALALGRFGEQRALEALTIDRKKEMK
jgi:hypothetical protein